MLPNEVDFNTFETANYHCILHLFRCFFCSLFHRLWVGVEDAQSDNYIPVNVVVSPSMTIAQLKEKVLTFQHGIDPTTNSDCTTNYSILLESFYIQCGLTFDMFPYLLPSTGSTLIILSMVPSSLQPVFSGDPFTDQP